MGKHQRMGKIFLILLSIFFLSLISATVTTLTPASSATISATATWNASGTVGFWNMMNCSLWGSSVALTANTTSVLLQTVSNNSATGGGANATWLNGSFVTSTFEDGNDYQLFTQCNNLSNIQQNSSANTAIIVNNTVPTAPSSLTPATDTLRTSSGTITFSSTVTNAETTSCTYVINRAKSSSDSKSASGTATYSASTCSFTKAFSGSNDNGIYSWTITASDGTETTTSGETNYNVQLAGGGGGIPQDSTPQKSNKILIIILVIVGLALLLNKGKK